MPGAWAKLARQAGQKYMVMTTKHHEGFCLWDTKLTNYCAAKQGPGRDLVREYVEASCVRDEGNYLLNIGPKPDGSIPEESVRVLTQVGEWMARNGESLYQSEVCQVRRNNYSSFTRKGDTLYMHVHYWPGETVAMTALRLE
jgi:alpha-L-fucosidase